VQGAQRHALSPDIDDWLFVPKHSFSGR
jgi:hypothetical protein